MLVMRELCFILSVLSESVSKTRSSAIGTKEIGTSDGSAFEMMLNRFKRFHTKNTAKTCESTEQASLRSQISWKAVAAGKRRMR
jgi:hypothetical protein